MCHLLLLYVYIGGIAIASGSPEADISSGYSTSTEATPASIESFSSTPILDPLGPTITTYSTVPQETLAILKNTLQPHVECKCNKKKTASEVKFGARSLLQTDGANSAVSQTEAVPTIVSGTPAPVDGSPVIYIAAPRTSHAQETVSGYNGYDTSANRVQVSPTTPTYSVLPGANHFTGQKIFSLAAGNTGNIYPGNPGIQYVANPAVYSTSPNNANLYQAQTFPSQTNYPKSTIGHDLSNHNSPYVFNPYDARLNYSPINPAGYAINPAFPHSAIGQNAAGQSDPNAAFIIYNTAPVAQANNQIHGNSPIANPFAAVAASTPRPILYGGQAPQNIAPQNAGGYGAYTNNAAAHSTAAGSPRPIIIYAGAPPVPPFPQYPYPAVNNNQAAVHNYPVPDNSAFSSPSSGISPFTGPVSLANGPTPLPAKALSVPTAHSYAGIVPGYSTNAVTPKPGTVYSSAPDVSRVQFNGGGISYSW